MGKASIKFTPRRAIFSERPFAIFRHLSEARRGMNLIFVLGLMVGRNVGPVREVLVANVGPAIF